MEDNILVDVVDASQLRTVSQALLNEVSSTKILLTTSNDSNDFHYHFPRRKSKSHLRSYPRIIRASGGGSPKIVTARSSKPKKDIIELLQKSI